MKSSTSLAVLLTALSSAAIPHTLGFAPASNKNGGVGRSAWGTTATTRARSFHKPLFAVSIDSNKESFSAVANDDDDDELQTGNHREQSQVVRAPLKYVGPYPCLALRFPNLATQSQRDRNVTGISLDFVLDTAANTNTIQQQVASELKLEVVGRALPGVGSAGVIAQGADTFMLGDAQLEGLVYDEGEEPFAFMSELTASALPVASPTSAGLLSLAFLQAFAGGVEFSWGTAISSSNSDPGTAKPPSVTFYGDKSVDEKAGVLKDRTKVTIDRVPITQLPSVTVSINGAEMRALLDTGSPITVMNDKAAELAGIETKLPAESSSNNPLKAFANRFQQAQAASRGDVLMIMGSDGRRINLVKSDQAAKVEMVASEEGTANVEFGSVPLYVGELPGLAALNGLGVESPPAVVLGMDVLRQRPSMLLRAQDNEVWFD